MLVIFVVKMVRMIDDGGDERSLWRVVERIKVMVVMKAVVTVMIRVVVTIMVVVLVIWMVLRMMISLTDFKLFNYFTDGRTDGHG